MVSHGTTRAMSARLKMSNPIKLTQTIRKDGRFYVRGYVINENRRREFSLTETTADKAFETLRRLQHDIDAVRAGAL